MPGKHAAVAEVPVQRGVIAVPAAELLGSRRNTRAGPDRLRSPPGRARSPARPGRARLRRAPTRGSPIPAVPPAQSASGPRRHRRPGAVPHRQLRRPCRRPAQPAAIRAPPGGVPQADRWRPSRRTSAFSASSKPSARWADAARRRPRHPRRRPIGKAEYHGAAARGHPAPGAGGLQDQHAGTSVPGRARATLNRLGQQLVQVAAQGPPRNAGKSFPDLVAVPAVQRG